MATSLLVAWFLFSSLLATNPTLHQWLHDDAAQSSHQCAITLSQYQQTLFHPPQPLVFALDFNLIYFVQPKNFSPVSAINFRWLPGRAPPASFSI
ncbi:MAG: hypothetical protein ACR2H1_14155 [Limisphaerales bacterium]